MGAASATAEAKYLQIKLLHHLRRDLDEDDEPFEREFEVDRTERLGKGSYGEVFVGTRRATGDKVAIKLFGFPGKRGRHSPNARKAALDEVSAHACLEPHPHIAQLLDIGVTRDRVALVSVMYQMDLNKYIKKSKAAPEMIQRFLACICEGLLHTHRNGLRRLAFAKACEGLCEGLLLAILACCCTI